MVTIIGLAVFGAAFVLTGCLSPWYLRHAAARPVLTELVTYGVIGSGVIGICLVFAGLVAAVDSRDVFRIAINVGLIVLAVLALAWAERRVSRWVAARARPTGVAEPLAGA